MIGLALAASALGASACGDAMAQEPIRHRAPVGRPTRTAALRPLTVHRHAYRAVPGPRLADGGYYTDEGPGLIRRWNDPNLYSFGGWRVGGDVFYGDERGDPITRGNSTLGAIAGYGPARGGYGGPHFDSVGGFHDGPGPDAQEDADYASGSVSTPDYGGITPRYPSVRQRLARLDAGVPVRPRPEPVADRPAVAPAPEPYAKADDIIPGLGLADDGAF